MQKLDEHLEEWSKLQAQIRILADQKKQKESDVLSIMTETKWQNYMSPDKISVSLTEEEVSEIDRGQLKLMLPVKDIEAITRYKTEKHLVIITPESRKNLNKVLKVLK